MKKTILLSVIFGLSILFSAPKARAFNFGFMPKIGIITGLAGIFYGIHALTKPDLAQEMVDLAFKGEIVSKKYKEDLVRHIRNTRKVLAVLNRTDGIYIDAQTLKYSFLLTSASALLLFSAIKLLKKN